jgi:LacI family transcriptional regulator
MLGCNVKVNAARRYADPMKMRMKDIAKELDLSVVTVSKVLRDHPDISDVTRERVLNYVKKVW